MSRLLFVPTLESQKIYENIDSSVSNAGTEKTIDLGIEIFYSAHRRLGYTILSIIAKFCMHCDETTKLDRGLHNIDLCFTVAAESCFIFCWLISSHIAQVRTLLAVDPYTVRGY